MKKIIKKVILIIVALLLCYLIIFSSVSLLDIPSSIDHRVDEVRAKWSRNVGPEIDGYDIDYSYYLPIENGASADKKYPMVIVMAGALEGLQEGFELVANAMPNWTTEEYQSRFENGGAYMFIARAPEEEWLYWDASKLTPSLMGAIDDFVQSNPNVDTNNIHIIGWCLGGNGAINLASSYPNYFASATIMCPDRAISENEAEALKNMPVWFSGSETDTYSSYKGCVLKSYERLCAVSNRPEDIRLTSYSSAPDVPLLGWVPFIFNHNLWDDLACDFKSENTEYTDFKVVDGNGNEIDDPSAISWIDSHTLEDGREEAQARDTESFTAKMKLGAENVKVFFKKGLMKLMLNTFIILGWM